MLITELHPGMLVLDYSDYEFVVASISGLNRDEYGDYIQINTECGNVVFYRQEHWNKFKLKD